MKEYIKPNLEIINVEVNDIMYVSKDEGTYADNNVVNIFE